MRKKIQEIVLKKPERKYVDDKRAKYFEKLFQKTREQFGEKLQEKEASEKEPEKESRSKFYNSSRWKKCRNEYYENHQTCELCALRNIQNKASEIHHKIKFFQQPKQDIKWKLLLDPDNLISLCKECHSHIHNNQALLDENQREFLRQEKLKIEKKYFDQGIIINLTNDKQKTEMTLF